MSDTLMTNMGCNGLNQIMPKSRKGSLSWNLLMQTRSLMVDDSTPETQLIFCPSSQQFRHQSRDPNYERKMKTSLVSECNRIQIELGKSTISSFSAAAWLSDDRPKVAIYPHQVDYYCDFCAKLRRYMPFSRQSIGYISQGAPRWKKLHKVKTTKKKRQHYSKNISTKRRNH